MHTFKNELSKTSIGKWKLKVAKGVVETVRMILKCNHKKDHAKKAFESLKLLSSAMGTRGYPTLPKDYLDVIAMERHQQGGV